MGAAMEIERQHLLALAEEGFELAETSFPTVDGKGCVKVRTNWYSTPVSPGRRFEQLASGLCRDMARAEDGGAA